MPHVLNSQPKAPSRLSRQRHINPATVPQVIKAHLIPCLLHRASPPMPVPNDAESPQVRAEKCYIDASAHVHVQVCIFQPDFPKAIDQVQQPFVHLLSEDFNQVEDHFAAKRGREGRG